MERKLRIAQRKRQWKKGLVKEKESKEAIRPINSNRNGSHPKINDMQKNVIITGAAGNLGKAAVEKFLSLDYNVIATVSPGKKLGYDTSGPVDTHELDLTNETAVEKFASRVIQAYGSIHAAVMLVGGFASGKISETNHALISKMHKLNFDTAYFLARPIFERMCSQQDGGRLILLDRVHR